MDAVMDEKEAKKFVHVHPKPAAERQRTLPEECCVEGCTNEEVRETGLGWTAVQVGKKQCFVLNIIFCSN
jgi:hypothetical protein